MATKIYESKNVRLVDGRWIYLTPLKIKYLREFMTEFDQVKGLSDEQEVISKLVDCAVVSMKQYCPEITTTEQLEDLVDLPTIYHILDVSAGIKINTSKEETVKDQATDSGSTWDTLDLAKLEAEVFLLGIWKDYEELEISLSMPELMSTLSSKRELDYNEKRFAASLKGINLDEQVGKKDAWEEMKARVFSKGKASDSNDILALQGQNAVNAGFGIGMGLDYEDLG